MILGKISKMLNNALKELDIAIVRRSQLASTWWTYDDRSAKAVKCALPSGAAEYLRHDNPRLLEYRRRYLGHPATRHSAWNEASIRAGIDLSHFRDDNMYIWQTRGLGLHPSLPFAVATDYIQQNDSLDLFSRLREDGLFGAITFPNVLAPHPGCVVSRDLLDSILEINFLERHLHLSDQRSITILDIGAGYGRLAHRLVGAFPNVNVLCTDAVAESTFVCEYYLKYRGVESRSRAIPLDMIEATLAQQPVQLVTNIQSFPECPIESIRWWLGLIARHQIPYFMLAVQNQANGESRLLSRERDDTRVDFLPLIEDQGFELMTSTSIYKPNTLAATYGFGPDRSHYLFRRRRV